MKHKIYIPQIIRYLSANNRKYSGKQWLLTDPYL